MTPVAFNSVTPVVLNVGFYNFVISDQILALIRSDSAPMRRVVQESRKGGTLIDATQGRKTKSVLFLTSGMTVASGAFAGDAGPSSGWMGAAAAGRRRG